MRKSKRSVSKLKQIYSLSISDFSEMLIEQDHICALGPEDCDGDLCVDHRGHNVRGLLCRKHNFQLGVYEKLVPIFHKIEDYLDGKLTKFRKIQDRDKCVVDDCKELQSHSKFCSIHQKYYQGYSQGRGKIQKIEDFQLLLSKLEKK